MKQFPTKQRASTRIGPHPKCILELMTGNLLGDGSLEKQHNATRFVFSQEEKNMEYLYWLHKQFALYGYCSQKKPVQHTRVGKRNTVPSSKEHNLRSPFFEGTQPSECAEP